MRIGDSIKAGTSIVDKSNWIIGMLASTSLSDFSLVVFPFVGHSGGLWAFILALLGIQSQTPRNHHTLQADRPSGPIKLLWAFA